MSKQLEKIKQFRRYILNEISSLTTAQLNAIPDGYYNNIIWNIGHLVSASQLLFFKRAGLPLTITDTYIVPFLPTTKPQNFIDATEIEMIKEMAIDTIEAMQSAYEGKTFENYIKSENIEQYYNMALLTIEDALDFLLYHEGYHSGKIIMLKQLIVKQENANNE